MELPEMERVLWKVHAQKRIKFVPQVECVKVQIITVANHKIKLVVIFHITLFLLILLLFISSRV